METFVNGEDTEVGEKGQNLSGGQKVRFYLLHECTMIRYMVKQQTTGRCMHDIADIIQSHIRPAYLLRESHIPMHMLFCLTTHSQRSMHMLASI